VSPFASAKSFDMLSGLHYDAMHTFGGVIKDLVKLLHNKRWTPGYEKWVPACCIAYVCRAGLPTCMHGCYYQVD
jgi:hypothetical protein